MSRSASSIALVAALSAVTLLARPRPAHACGPDLPVELLSDRGAIMSELPEAVFLDEITRLVSSPGPYTTSIPSAPDPGSPAERALYDLGAAAFHAGDRAEAIRAFEQLLALPYALRRARATSAAYTLGRIHAAAGDTAAAIAAYRQVRALVDHGAADPAALAWSSFGQEARLFLDRGGPGDTLTAVELYAQQAAVGGDPSLLFVVRELLADTTPPARLDEVLGTPLGQHLFALYLSARGDELDDATRDRLWARLIAGDSIAGADQLATAAYQRGEWEVAAQLAARAADTPRAYWVRAKLAMRAGDRATAREQLELAAGGFGQDRTHWAQRRITGERATLALADGRVAEAMDHAWAVRGRYPDAIYLAERVLTLDELTAFVDRVAPPRFAPAPTTRGRDAAIADVTTTPSDDDLADVTTTPSDDDLADVTTTPSDDDLTWGLPTPALMRDLLGRRLMRAGRYRDALTYLAPEHRLAAFRFARARARAETGDRIDRAGALIEASRIARRDGLEILGTTAAPDWGLYDGEYDPDGWRAWSDEPPPPRTPWHSDAEDVRVAASAPSPVKRFHYRFIASKLAEDAADLLPHQSQAFAISLCLAARHVRYRDEDRVQALYARYIDEGPMFAGMDFGQSCPEPELERARRFLPPPPEPRWPIAVIAAVYLAGALFLMRRLRPGRHAMRP